MSVDEILEAGAANGSPGSSGISSLDDPGHRQTRQDELQVSDARVYPQLHELEGLEARSKRRTIIAVTAARELVGSAGRSTRIE